MLELLVVIAIIAILATLGFSALAQAKSKAQQIQCMNNQRHLTLACLIYVDDHDDYFPYNYGYADTESLLQTDSYWNWVNNLMSWDLDDYNTNTALLNKGGLAPYNGGMISIYKCPADFVLSDLQKGAGWTARTRSFSLNAMIGNAGQFTIGGSNTNNPGYRQFFKSSQIPDPSNIFLFIEEHPDSITDGYFLNQIDSFVWRDLPASTHNGGTEISFADGHVDYRQWQCSSTKRPARPDGANLPLEVPVGERADFQWLMSHTSVKDR